MIKDCPFCGATEKSGQVKPQEIDMGIWAVVCDACRAIGPHVNDAAQEQATAVRRWNTLRGVK